MITIGAVVLLCAVPGAGAEDLPNVLGVTHVAGRYHLTDKDFLNEGADQILGLGSRVIKVDLISYSAWDSATAHYADPNVLRDALDFIAAHALDSPDFGNCSVYIGEFGMPENFYSLEQIQTAIPNAIRTGLDWGCPYLVYWQLYCNELKDPNTRPPVKSNDAVRGFWLIRPDGTKSWVWDYFHGLFMGPEPTQLDPDDRPDETSSCMVSRNTCSSDGERDIRWS